MPRKKKKRSSNLSPIKDNGEVTDFGSEDPIYANVAIDVAEAVAAKEYDRGILICGTGIGVSIAANKVKGAYAALVSDVYSAQRAKLSNDANICVSGRLPQEKRCGNRWWTSFWKMNLRRDAPPSLRLMRLCSMMKADSSHAEKAVRWDGQ